MADNRLNSLNDYEQLKRRNRRRLVGASVMVLLAGLLLAKVLNQGDSQDTAQSISINGASDVQTASETEAPQVAINNQAAPADDASDLSPAAVLEPAPEGNTRATVLENPLASTETPVAPAETEAVDPDKVFEDAVVNEPVESTVAAETPKAAVAETKPAAPAARNNAAAVPPPVVVINNRAADKPATAPAKPTADKQAADKAAAEQKAAQQRQAEQRAADARQREAQQAAAKTAEQKKAQQAQQAKQQAARDQAKKQADAAAAKKKQQAAAQKKPQDILNNKAAQTTAKADPKAILEGRNNAASGGKAIIQAGAFSNREQAAQVRQKLANAGVSAYISEAETSKGTVYRVRTGSYADRAAANQALAKIRQQGVDGMVIGQ